MRVLFVGLRTLCLAERVLSEEEFQARGVCHEHFCHILSWNKNELSQLFLVCQMKEDSADKKEPQRT